MLLPLPGLVLWGHERTLAWSLPACLPAYLRAPLAWAPPPLCSPALPACVPCCRGRREREEEEGWREVGGGRWEAGGRRKEQEAGGGQCGSHWYARPSLSPSTPCPSLSAQLFKNPSSVAAACWLLGNPIEPRPLPLALVLFPSPSSRSSSQCPASAALVFPAQNLPGLAAGGTGPSPGPQLCPPGLREGDPGLRTLFLLTSLPLEHLGQQVRAGEGSQKMPSVSSTPALQPQDSGRGTLGSGHPTSDSPIPTSPPQGTISGLTSIGVYWGTETTQGEGPGAS